MSTSRLRLLASLGSMSLLAGCGPAQRATPSPAPGTSARPAPTASAPAASAPASAAAPAAGPKAPEKPALMADVDAAAVSAQCAKIEAKQHASLDALAKKGLPAAQITAAKELFGKCQPVGKAARPPRKKVARVRSDPASRR
ncbi:MAG: hypothetical protein IPM54_40490 [Polyangiaceae bacterium]|nr:hypothetical protein [Polyangiaceae bacterium]